MVQKERRSSCIDGITLNTVTGRRQTGRQAKQAGRQAFHVARSLRVCAFCRCRRRRSQIFTESIDESMVYILHARARILPLEPSGGSDRGEGRGRGERKIGAKIDDAIVSTRVSTRWRNLSDNAMIRLACR